MRKLIAALLIVICISGFSSQGVSEVYQTSSGRSVRITETHPVGASLSNIRIQSEGFDHEFDETYVDADPIRDVFVADLDGDGFDEVYVITVAAGSGSHGGVIGVASNRDVSMSIINFPEIVQGEPNFKGYMGHDSFSIQSRRLVRTFPIYRTTDTNAEATGGTRRIVYRLAPGEALWQLRVESVQTID
jgi:hypothetical protein